MKTIALDSAPSPLALYARAIVDLRPGPVPKRKSQLARATLHGVRSDLDRLQAYREVCGFPGSDVVPLTWPFVLATPLQLRLLVSDAFPFPAMGIVHLRNRIVRHQPIRLWDAMDLDCRVSGPRRGDKGLEFDFHTRATTHLGLAWECVATFLKRAEKTGRTKHKPTQDAAPKSGMTEYWDLPEDLGRRYGRASGDINPIHLHALSARMFGFRRAIAQGMYTKARCVAALDADLPTGPLQVDVAFKTPILLPSRVRFVHWPEGSGTGFAVRDEAGEKPHLEGSVGPLH